MRLRIITPKQVVFEDEVAALTAPSVEGEITILPHHTKLFSLLKEGVLKIKLDKGEDFYAIGGGFLETDGSLLNVLVSRAYGQDEIDEKATERAVEQAKKALTESKNKIEIHEASALLRRSLVDLKLLKLKRRRVH